MDSGIISALGYSYLLATFPVAIFAYALSTAIFPFLSDAFAANNKKQSSYLLGRGISVSLLLSCPAVVMYWLFAREFVIILFQRGAFDYQSVAYTAGLLKYFAWAFPGQFILYVMSRAYFAARRFDILFVQIVLMVIAKILLTALGVNLYGAAGLPLATAASYSLGALVLLVLANRCLTQLDGRSLLAYFAKVLTATLIYGAVAFGLNEILGYAQQGIFSVGLKLLICTIIPLMVFAATAFILKIPEVTELLKSKQRGA
jgi:putative peptidoglycan lipid II flippase